MNITKKFLVVLIATAMLLCSFPSSVFATTDDIDLAQYSETHEQTIEIGDCITLGTYLGESIVWRCVDIDENGPLMLSEKILSLKAFDANGKDGYYHSDGWGYIRKRYGSNCWEDSNLRQWLNSDEAQVSWSHCPPASGTVTYNPYSDESGFLTGFSYEEKACIKNVTQPVNVNVWETKRGEYCEGGQSDRAYANVFKSDFGVTNYYYKNIADSVFLLTSAQLHRIYENNPEYLLASPTQNAVDQSDYKDTDVASDVFHDYWVNIPWGNDYACYEHTMRITEGGQLVNEAAYSGYVGVRPAFYLDLNNYDYFNKKVVIHGREFNKNIDYFTTYLDSSSYSPVLSNMLAALSAAAYDEQEMTTVYESLGFTAPTITNDYTGNDENKCGSAVGIKESAYNGDTVCLVTLRGTVGAFPISPEWKGNFDIRVCF